MPTSNKILREVFFLDAMSIAQDEIFWKDISKNIFLRLYTGYLFLYVFVFLIVLPHFNPI